MIEQDTRSRRKTQTNLRTRPKPATRLQLGHKLNNTNSEIESAKAKSDRLGNGVIFFVGFSGL